MSARTVDGEAPEPFESLLHPPGGAASGPPLDDQAAHDLALDQVLDEVDRPGLSDVWRRPLTDAGAVRFRQDVFRGLEDPAVRTAVEHLIEGMENAREADGRAARSRYPLQRARLHLGAVADYCSAVAAAAEALSGAVHRAAPESAGLRGLVDHVHSVESGSPFRELREHVRRLTQEWSGERFALLVRGGRLTVAPFDDEPSLTDEVERVFRRFREQDAPDHRVAFTEGGDLDHVQGWVLEAFGQVHPDLAGRLTDWSAVTAQYVDELLDEAAREAAFYLAWLDYLAPVRAAGLEVAYPDIDPDRHLHAEATFDVVLARSVVSDGRPVVRNDLDLSGAERLLVVSGPNQGGKTTTARTFGQLHHLAAIGCPVPGRAVRIHLADRVLTCFGREEHLDALEGRLGEEVDRVHAVLGAATADSVIVLNEVFASTALEDATAMTRVVLERIRDLDALCLCVTFIDELSRLDSATVSLVAAVAERDPGVRTFRLERRRADGRAYALALAERHGLGADELERRITDGALR